jgi:phosphopantothenoylcysteine decarboxylase/phosphopantothenate--cysteine ligase
MDALSNKKIILCVTGSIAAYKTAFLTRLLIKQRNAVRVIMTPAASDFISPLTLSTLSKHEVVSDVSDGASWNNHVELGLWADAMLIAPCTANTLGKMANGIVDNMVLATYLSAKCPVFVAPAMDLDMWKHPSTKKNIAAIQSYGNQIIPVGHGELASGLSGEGRMAEPEDICAFLNQYFKQDLDLTDKRVLVTAGPTYEALDPVRFIGNHSSGKMGIEIARAFAQRGATVELILGPSTLSIEHPNITIHPVKSAQEMYEEVQSYYSETDVSVFAAAVADYRPAHVSSSKLKKKEDDLTLQLERTIDIAATMGKKKQAHQINIGFALETDNEKVNAKKKLDKKNFDLIVLNSMNDKGAGFRHDTNKVTLFDQGGGEESLPLQSKAEVARKIVDKVASILFDS